MKLAPSDPIHVLARMQAQDPRISAFYVTAPFFAALMDSLILEADGSAEAFACSPMFNGTPVLPYPVETDRSFVVGIRPRDVVDDFLHPPFLFTEPPAP